MIQGSARCSTPQGIRVFICTLAAQRAASVGRLALELVAQLLLEDQVEVLEVEVGGDAAELGRVRGERPRELPRRAWATAGAVSFAIPVCIVWGMNR